MEIAVIAGTPIDTQMGVEFLVECGYRAKGYAISKTPQEQSNLQILYPDQLKRMVIDKIHVIKKQAIENVFVYCNSLSGAVNMEKLSLDYNINIITPLQIYREIGEKYNRIAVLAANNQSTFAIEKSIQETNPHSYVIGIGLLPLVKAIEAKIPPKDIMVQFAFKNIMEFFEKNRCEVIILGCTHFPYLYQELKKITPIPILDPAYRMLTKIKTD